MSARTVFLSRLIGLFLLLFSLSMLLHGRASGEIVNRLAKDPPLLMLMGMLALLGGLAMVLSHNVWSGGFVPVVVTVLGWVLTLRGLPTLLIPPDAMARLMQSARFEDRLSLFLAIPLILGAGLTYAGFAAGRRSSAPLE